MERRPWGQAAAGRRQREATEAAVLSTRFFATLRAELVDHERYPTRDAASAAIADYIENFYNIERRHSHLDYLNPIEFELRSQIRRHVT